MNESMKAKWTAPVMINNCEIHCPITCVTLGDISLDNDVKLIVATGGHRGLNMKLKVFKGVSPHSESSLADVPTAIVHFVNDFSSMPSIAVASGPALLIYKNLKPYYKFTVPTSPINPVEAQAWTAAQSDKISIEELYTVLNNLSSQISISNLSPLSQTLLLTPEKDRNAVVERYLHKQMSNSATITCVSKMVRSSADKIDVFLIGTEHSMVYLVDSQAYQIIGCCSVPSPPVTICPYGNYDVDFRLIVLTRDSCVYSIKRDQTEATKPIINSASMITSIIRINKMVVYTTADNTISFNTLKGKKINTIKCEQKVKMLEVFEYTQKQYTAVLAMFEKEVHMYNESYLLDVLKFDRQLAWIKYGGYGREEGALIICFKDGSVNVRMWRRLATFDEKMDFNPRPPAHSIKLAIPKKTKIFIDSTVREKDNAAKIHSAYYKDLLLLRCRIAEVFSELTQSASTVVSTDSSLPMELSADVDFRLIVLTRDSCVYSIKRDQTEATKPIINSASMIQLSMNSNQ
ncbi:unnamed protein product [Caenorhabditis angaria]|uniref:Bardet-Biedl syndrome 1 N-terminal domain-containing protein n=1 Tax=Caenorhabditis angaria TaxID=860376 RepID=A0A9P1I509_9PELO|nr:unnamed protein product [Caenorhabditis angaria]